MPVIRRPRPEEAEAVAECLRRSIVELCHADHGGDPDKYTPWIANKTAENMVRWMDQAEGFLLSLIHILCRRLPLPPRGLTARRRGRRLP